MSMVCKHNVCWPQEIITTMHVFLFSMYTVYFFYITTMAWTKINFMHKTWQQTPKIKETNITDMKHEEERNKTIKIKNKNSISCDSMWTHWLPSEYVFLQTCKDSIIVPCKYNWHVVTLIFHVILVPMMWNTTLLTFVLKHCVEVDAGKMQTWIKINLMITYTTYYAHTKYAQTPNKKTIRISQRCEKNLK